MSIIIIFLLNLGRRVRNLWRRLFRRRIDWVRMELSGALPEVALTLPWWRRRFTGATAPLSMLTLRRRFEQLADDKQVQGVLLVVRDLSAGWAKLQGLHEILAAYRASGGQVVAYLPAADTRAYFAACGADALLMPPTAYLNLTGLRVEASFFGDALRLAGLEAEVVAVSPYKSGGDSFTRGEISPQAREQLERLVDERFAMLVETVGAARGLASDAVRKLIDRAPLLATAAQQAGLLDGALYEDEIERFLETHSASRTTQAGVVDPTLSTTSSAPSAVQNKLSIVDWNAAARRLPLPLLRRERRYIGLITVEGAIAQGASQRSPLPLPLFGGNVAGSDSVIQALRRAERDRRVAAVVLHVDSPGGDAFASDLIWREALRLSLQKPLVVSMGDTAASGGYYIAAPARAIVARPATLTGSIGVYALRPNAAKLLDRLEVGTAVIARGAQSGLFSPLGPLADEERAALRRTVFETYEAFKLRVRQGRGLSEEQLEPIAGGRVWTGREALQHGLVDDLGGLPAATARARELANLPADPRAPLLLIRGAGRGLTPPPFPTPPPEPNLPTLLGEALRTRVLAALPWVLREL